MENILVLFSDYVEDYEVMVPFQILQMIRQPVHAVCPDKAAGGVLESRLCTAYPVAGPDVTRAGGTFVDLLADEAHVDGNLVSAPAWPAHPARFVQFL